MTHRQQFILDVTNHYIKNNKDEYKAFIKQTKLKKQKLTDKELATFNDGRGRHAFTLPQGLYMALDCSLDNPRFAREDKEIRWFAKKFPQFMLGYEY